MSEQKCFCHLNGYAVKDATARAEIETLKSEKVSHNELSEATAEIEATTDGLREQITNLDTRFNYLDIPTQASDLAFANEGTGLTATDVQSAIAEVKNIASSVEQGTALGTTFDNSSNGMSSTNVQSAIEEVKTMAEGGGTAESTTYDNSSSNLEATTVQGAIDEVNSNFDVDYDLSSFVAPPIYDSRATIVSGGYKQVGNKVYVNVTFKNTIDFSMSSWTIFEELPSERCLSPLLCACDYGGGLLVEAKVLSGTLIINPVKTVPKNSTISIVGYYYVS